MKKWLFIYPLIFLFGCSSEEEKTIPAIELGKWEFEYKGKWFSAAVPGTIHTDLFAHNIIEDPFYGNNEQELQWIEDENWSYKNTFTVTQEQLQDKHIEINFKGLDTYAEVKLNGVSILKSDNMFRSWQVDIKEQLKVGENMLEVEFTSPLEYNKEHYANYPWKLPSGSETKEPRVGSFTRKAPYHFGWDWGPRFVTCGIWRPIEINSWNVARITDVYCETVGNNGIAAQLKAHIQIEADVKGQELTSVALQIDDTTLFYGLEDGMNDITYEFEVDSFELWWPNGHHMGKPKLYGLDVCLSTNDDRTDKTSIRYGIRKIKLINEPDDIGTSFYFEVNGHPTFMKGGNYIPQDVFIPRVSEEQYRKLLTACKEAGMNMIRVWGGGIYENDIFYDLCDEYGILVWQDFMFAGSLYPHHNEFLNTVKEEVKENIIRLRKHPCIAIWCGNNEIKVAIDNWGWQEQYGYSESTDFKTRKDYEILFEKIIPAIVNELDPNTAYTPTSPLSNWGTPENFNHSSMHYWGVWHGKETFENFEQNVGRFMVEYGFQSFPSMETIAKFAPDSSWSLESDIMQNRQKSYIGNGLILKHIKQYFDEPTSFAEFVNLSQKTQAKAMQMAIAAHLAKQPHCMGSLFWQINDCWPGPSWSVIDYYGNKKEAYFAVKEAFLGPKTQNVVH